MFIDKILLEDYYRNNSRVQIPVKYIAFNKNGVITNLRGDTYSKKKIYNNNFIEPFYGTIEDLTYDEVITNFILNCKDYILDPSKLVFLIDDNLYDIFGCPISFETEEIINYENTQPEIIDNTTNSETNESTQTIDEIYNNDFCSYILLDFNNNINDYYNNVKTKIVGNAQYSNGVENQAFNFDGNTYLLVETNNIENPFTISLWIKPLLNSAYKCAVSMTRNNENTFNIIIQDNNLLFYYNNKNVYKKSIDTNNFTHFAITSEGKIYINGSYDSDVGSSLDLSNLDTFIGLGADLDSTSASNYFEGFIDNFRICKEILTDEQISYLYNNKDKNIS